MHSPDYDCIVVGCGGAGSAASYYISKAGLGTLILEQYGLGHANGSSHGATRIYRTSYFEGRSYVPLVKRAQKLWWNLAAESDRRLIEQTGAVFIGKRQDSLITGALASARRYGLPHEILERHEARERFPQFQTRDDQVIFWERQAGVLFPERCIEAYVRSTRKLGGTFNFNERVLSWSAGQGVVRVRTSLREYTARSLVLTVGPWVGELVPELHAVVALERQTVFWFRPRQLTDEFGRKMMPVFVCQTASPRIFYGVPDFGTGVKVASESGQVIQRPSQVHDPPPPSVKTRVLRFVSQYLPGLDTRPTKSLACIYTNSPDHHFIVGRHPRFRNVTIVSACSGHGFKFAPVIGELAAQAVRGLRLPSTIKLFSPTRFGWN